MRTFVTRSLGPTVAVLALWTLASAPVAHAAQFAYTAVLNGVAESPPNASAGVGTCEVDVDDVAHTMRVRAVFSGLVGNTTASHIHCATATPFTATTTPTFLNFPLGVTSGSYDITLDMTQASSYNPAFVTLHGGSIPASEAFIYQSLADGTAYLNIHSTAFPGGEIRGFPVLINPTPVEDATWGGLKALYR
jgi:hypothetical protein